MRKLMIVLAASSSLYTQAVLAQAEGAPEADTADSGEILVTAQRRSERLVEVPISITALNGDMLERAGIRSTEDLTAVVPGLNFATNGAFAQPTIRGIGTTVTSAGNDANVAIYVDGVYQPNQIGNFSDLVDLDQVEVLKGPQGTLFGRNATGGAIRVTTRRPSFTPEARGTISYGRFDEVRLTAFGTTPLSDTVATSFTFSYGDDQGYARNVGTGNRVADTNSVALRGRLLFQPSESVEFILSAGHAERVSNPSFTLGVLNGNNNSLTGSILANGPREVSLTVDPSIEVESDQVSLMGSFDLGFAELSSITSYSQVTSNLVTDVDRTNRPLVLVDLPGNQKTWSQEFNLVSQGDGPMQWFVGAFYYNDTSSNAVIINKGATFNAFELETEAFAPFGEVNITLGNLMLIAGARYNIERKDYTFTRGALSQTPNETFRTFTPRLGLRYSLSDDANVYASYTKGFKSGAFDGIFSGGALVVNTVEPETVNAYELGFKYGSGRTSLSVSAYFYDYTNIQFQAFNPNAGGLTQVFNAAAAEIYGAEIEGSIELADGFLLRGSAAYTNSEYLNFPGASILCPRGAPSFGNESIALGALNPCTGQLNTAGATGNNLIRTPEFTASLGPSYSVDLNNGGTLDLSANAFWSGSFFWDPANRIEEDSYVLVNAEIGYTFPGDQVKLALWGRNLANELYSLYVTESAGGDSVAYARPRTFGIRAELNF